MTFVKVTISPFISYLRGILGKNINFVSTQERSVIGIKITKDRPNNSYLVFANDYLVICRAREKAARNVRYIQDHYCRVSEQLVNYHNGTFNSPSASIKHKEENLGHSTNHLNQLHWHLLRQFQCRSKETKVDLEEIKNLLKESNTVKHR